MKILVIEHTAWIEMMVHAWQVLGAEVACVRVPVPAMTTDPAMRFEAAETIRRMIRESTPDFVVDVNAVGVLPLDAAGTQWTTQQTDAPWCLWWWDAPHACAFPLHRPEESANLLGALRAESVQHFFWDAVLANEYSTWLGRPCHYLPTATHPGLFHPDAIAASVRQFEPVQATFLGSYYPLPRKSSLPGIHELARSCMRNHDASFFELARQRMGTFDAFQQALETGLQSSEGPFHPEVLQWKAVLDRYIGYERRTVYLHRLLEEVDRLYVAGTGWPDVFDAQAPLYQPAHLVMRYQSSLLNPDFGNGSSFRGTTLRCYEVMASGAVLLCDRNPDFDSAGELEDKVYLAYSSPDECMEKIRAYRSRPRLLDPLRERARAFIAERHSWAHRLSDIVGVLAGTPSAAQKKELSPV